MLHVFLCHAPDDRETAALIARRIESTAEARVLLDETSNVANSWDSGLSCDAIIVLLSSRSVPRRATRDEWASLLDHQEGHQEPPVLAVALENAAWPKLIERRAFLRWTDPQLESLRAIDRFVIAAHRPSAQQVFIPAKVEGIGHTPQLESLWAALVDRCGALAITGPAGSGKSALAQQLAHDAREHFRDILWIACGDRTLRSLACEIAANFGTVLEGEIEAAAQALARQISKHRLLLILDDARIGVEDLIPREGFTSAIVTARDPAVAPGIARMTLRQRDCTPHGGGLPEPATHLWRALSACFGPMADLRIAAQTAGIPDSTAAVRVLLEAGIVQPVDAAGSYLRLREAHASPLVPEHAAVLHELFRRWPLETQRCLAAVRDVPRIRDWALQHDWRLAAELSRWAFSLLRTQGRVLEAAELLSPIVEEARRRGDEKVAEECEWELSWIRTAGEAVVKPPDVEATQLSLF
ncbi:MAG: TIR domain-containing protein [Bryobacterales bacterium]|nr:TIR domain-containing protein [Bryobacterales bacterium]